MMFINNEHYIRSFILNVFLFLICLYHDIPKQVTESFVETASALSKRVLSSRKLMDLLLQADELGNNPFDSYTKLQIMLNKAKSPRNIEWCFTALYLDSKT